MGMIQRKTEEQKQKCLFKLSTVVKSGNLKQTIEHAVQLYVEI